MTKRLGRFARQNTIGLLALFIALGGTSAFAAATLINGSQIKPHTIAKNRLTNKAIKQLKGNRGPAGAQGQRGPTGAQGVQGIQGPAGPITGDLPAGVTLRGTWGAEGEADTNSYFGNAASYGLRLSSAPTSHFIANGGTPPAQCPGTIADPQAAPGNLCVYEGSNFSNRSTVEVATADPGMGRYGFDYLIIRSTNTGNFWSYGTWAVTAPTTAAPTHPAKRRAGVAGTSSQ